MLKGTALSSHPTRTTESDELSLRVINHVCSQSVHAPAGSPSHIAHIRFQELVQGWWEWRVSETLFSELLMVIFC
jgi:hypothetical protein